MRYTNNFIQFLNGCNTIVISRQKDFETVRDAVEKVELDFPWTSYYHLCHLARINGCLIKNEESSIVLVEYQPGKGFTIGYKSIQASVDWYGLEPIVASEIYNNKF